ncbi:TPA: hypothetical protein ACH3X1_007949 [Trebouxia sp. C0004]
MAADDAAVGAASPHRSALGRAQSVKMCFPDKTACQGCVELKRLVPSNKREDCLRVLKRLLDELSDDEVIRDTLRVLTSLQYDKTQLRASRLGPTLQTLSDGAEEVAPEAQQVLQQCHGVSKSQDIRVPQATNVEGASGAGSSAAEIACVPKQRYSKQNDPALVTSIAPEAASHSSSSALVPFIRRPQDCPDCDANFANKKGWQVCTECSEYCRVPLTDETLYCDVCIQSVHRSCRQAFQQFSHPNGGVDHADRRIICSEGCQQILSGMHRLVQESRAKGAIRLASPDYPPGFAVTITAGQDKRTDSQTDIILPAENWQAVAQCSWSSFVYRTHQLWYYNQTYTAVLFTDVPSNGFVNVKLKKITPRVPPDLEEVRRINQGKKACQHLRLEQQHAERLAKLQGAESACGKHRRSMPERINLLPQKNLKSLIPDTPSSDSKIAAIKSSRNRQL